MSNLPPGVTDSMIPGNSPADQAFDGFCETLTTFLDKTAMVKLSDEAFEVLSMWIWEMLQRAQRDGYAAALADIPPDETP